MAKKPSHTFHGIPLLSAMSNILFIVPRSRTRVESKVSFIFSASAELSRISSPIALVICIVPSVLTSQICFSTISSFSRDRRIWTPKQKSNRGSTYILQHPHLPQNPLHLIIILTLQLVQHSITVLALAIRRRGSVPSPRLPRTEVTGRGRAVAVAAAHAGRWRRAGVGVGVAGEELGAGVALVEGGCAESAMFVSLWNAR